MYYVSISLEIAGKTYNYRRRKGDTSAGTPAWVTSGEGVILPCEDGEYEFGRFAFDPAGNGEAHAFLYFHNWTDFTETGFLGRPPLRKKVPKARFALNPNAKEFTPKQSCQKQCQKAKSGQK